MFHERLFSPRSTANLFLTMVIAAACQMGAAHLTWGAPPMAEKPLQRPDKIKFRDEAGKTTFSLKLKDDGGKLVDGNEKELARYTCKEHKVKIKDAEDKVLGYVIIVGEPAKIERLRLEGPDEKTELFVLKHQPDGDWKLEDPQQMRVYTIKKRDYGAEIKDAKDESLYKVKNKEGHTSLRNEAEKTVYHTNEAISAPAMACLGLDKISDVRLRAALMFAIDHGPHHEVKTEAK
jgi:hypothetical protein